MKVAIASNGKELSSEMSNVAGRAPYYLIFEDKKLVNTIKNPFAVGGGGAGFGVAKMLEKENIDMIIVGHIGQNMEGALKSAGIKYKKENNKTIKQIIDNL
jgi:predicted Fe-Mo cluster-binding NifX family protein